jgi:hypothetical protein
MIRTDIAKAPAFRRVFHIDPNKTITIENSPEDEQRRIDDAVAKAMRSASLADIQGSSVTYTPAPAIEGNGVGNIKYSAPTYNSTVASITERSTELNAGPEALNAALTAVSAKKQEIIKEEEAAAPAAGGMRRPRATRKRVGMPKLSEYRKKFIQQSRKMPRPTRR